RHVGDQALQAQGAKIGYRNLGQRLIGHGECEIALPREHPLDLVLVLAQADRRLPGRALLAIGERLAAYLLHCPFQYLGHQRAAIKLLQVRKWLRPRAEAPELNGVLDLAETLIEARAQLLLVDNDLELAL